MDLKKNEQNLFVEFVPKHREAKISVECIGTEISQNFKGSTD